MNAQSPGRRLLVSGKLAFLVFAPFAACDDSAGPPPVSTVQVSGAQPLQVGDSVQLVAMVRDAEGNELTDRDVAWSSSDDSIGSVSLTGLVKANAAGDVTITAESESAQGTADINVFSDSEVSLKSIAPGTLRPGGTATLTGEGFSTTLSANVVSVGGERATVTGATPTELTVLVSATACQVTGDVDVRVTVDHPGGNPEESQALGHPFEAEGESFSLAVGELTLIEPTRDFCLRFGATNEGEAYLIGLQSTAMSVGTVTPATVSASAGGAGASLARAELGDVARDRATAAAGPLPTAQTTGLSGPAFGAVPGRGTRWQRHRQMELSLRRQELQLLEWARPLASPSARRALANVGARSTATNTSIVANVQVGDTVPIRVPKLDDVCAGFDSIATIVRVVGDHAVWLEDVDNPAGGYTSDDFKQLNQIFDDRIYETNVEYFGEPLDLDENERIGIVTTKEVNAEDNVLGFVSAADLFPRTSCASSDFGELYYGRTPDPAGEFGEEYTLAAARLDAPQLIAHEFAHIIQFSGLLRIEGPAPATAIWNLEGQALIAEELNGHAATGRSTGQNYGFDVAWTGVPGEDEEQTEIAWYVGGFGDLFRYYGFRDPEVSVPGAPEECSWLGLEEDGNDGPCDLGGRDVYGVPWTLLRWLADHFSADVGGEAAFQRGLVKRGSSGFTAIAELVPVSRNRWLAEWAAALYVDDRVEGANSRLTLPSWNLLDIEARIVETAHLRPRQRAFEGFSDDVNVRAGSTAYFCIGRAQGGSVDCASAGTGRPETVVRARDALGGDLPSHMQLWVVRLE